MLHSTDHKSPAVIALWDLLLSARLKILRAKRPQTIKPTVRAKSTQQALFRVRQVSLASCSHGDQQRRPWPRLLLPRTAHTFSSESGVPRRFAGDLANVGGTLRLAWMLGASETHASKTTCGEDTQRIHYFDGDSRTPCCGLNLNGL